MQWKYPRDKLCVRFLVSFSEMNTSPSNPTVAKLSSCVDVQVARVFACHIVRFLGRLNFTTFIRSFYPEILGILLQF